MDQTNLEKNTIGYTMDSGNIFKQIHLNNNTINNESEEVWVNNIKADGGAYKGCPKNDYCQHFVDTGERPQNFIRDYDEDKRFLDYPKLNELIKRKNEILNKRATPAMYLKTDLKTFDLSSLGKFDVILIDPPWEDYYINEPNKSFIKNDKNDSFWSYDEIADLKIDSISENCSFLFLWVGSGKGLDYGRALLKKWGFRRCEDIVWIKTNKHSTFKKKYKDQTTLIQHSKEHCLVGIKGAVKRGSDRNFIHANIDTDVIVAEEPPDNNTEKPHELYRIIERFCLGRKRIELFGEDHNTRSGWLTLGKSISNSNFDLEKYNSWFTGDQIYPDVQGYEGGRYVGTTSEIESLRPRSPVRNYPNSNSVNTNNQTNSYSMPHLGMNSVSSSMVSPYLNMRVGVTPFNSYPNPNHNSNHNHNNLMMISSFNNSHSNSNVNSQMNMHYGGVFSKQNNNNNGNTMMNNYNISSFQPFNNGNIHQQTSTNMNLESQELNKNNQGN